MPGAPPSWQPGPVPVAPAPLAATAVRASRATSAPRCVQGSRVVPPPSVNRYPVVVQASVAYSPGVKVLRQVSSPNLSPTATAMVVPAAQSPGLVVKHRGAVCAPLPTWAAPATPPRAGMTGVVRGTGAPEKESDPVVPGTAAPPKPGTVPRRGSRGVDEDALRARLEETRRELTQKMSELRELEASLLSTSFTKRLSDHSLTRPFDVLVEESETAGQSSGTPSPDSQAFFKCSTKAVATDTDDLLCTEAGPGPAPQGQPDALPEAPEGQQLEQSATSGISAIGDTKRRVEPLAEAVEMVEIAVPVPIVPVQPTPEGRENSQENGKVKVDLKTDSKADSKADCKTNSKADKVQVQLKRDRSTSVPKRVQILPPRPSSISSPTTSASSAPSAPSAARSRTSSVKERPRMATQLHIPVSARLSSRRAARNANTAMEKSFSARELSRPLPADSTGASGSAVNSAPTGTLEVADVARLVASPEIGTLDDFLPNPVPEPEVLSEHSAAQKVEVNGKSEVAKVPCKDPPGPDAAPSSNPANPGRRRSVPGSPKRGAVREAPETARTGSRMLWSQQLTALSCSELPRRSPSPQRMPRATVPSRAKTPLRGSSAQVRISTEVDVPSSRTQKKQVTWKPRPRPSEAARESGRNDRNDLASRRKETSEDS